MQRAGLAGIELEGFEDVQSTATALRLLPLLTICTLGRRTIADHRAPYLARCNELWTRCRTSFAME